MNENEAPQVRMKANGDLILRYDGQDSPIAHYERTTGHLEYENKEFSVKYHTQVTSKIGSVAKGTQPSNLIIRTIGIKGEARPDPKTLPKRPKLGPSGDAGYEFVKWMIENDLPQAVIRYGIFLDEKGNPVRKHCRREQLVSVDARNSMDDGSMESREAHAQKVGKGKEVAPIYRTNEFYEDKKGIVARRATDVGPDGEPPMTFTPNEVVGGFQPEDEWENGPVGQEAEVDA